jgi:hypothetical protein
MAFVGTSSAADALEADDDGQIISAALGDSPKKIEGTSQRHRHIMIHANAKM